MSRWMSFLQVLSNIISQDARLNRWVMSTTLGHVSGAMDCGVLEEMFDLSCDTVPLMREVKTCSCECVQLIEKKGKEPPVTASPPSVFLTYTNVHCRLETSQGIYFNKLRRTSISQANLTL